MKQVARRVGDWSVLRYFRNAAYPQMGETIELRMTSSEKNFLAGEGKWWMGQALSLPDHPACRWAFAVLSSLESRVSFDIRRDDP